LAPPGAATAVLKDVSFSLERGQALAVIGPSGSGKSSLARALMGIWPAHSGTVRLDGADITQWPAESLGEYVGYLPQQIELLTGTIGENVARFDPNRRPEDVIAAAQGAGVHELILGLPQGYDTVVGLGGLALSTGQQQRLALARALYREPFLIVLDEPNSSLDHEGETALANAILGVRQRGGIAVVISHRPSTLSAVGHILLLYAGRVLKFGPKEAVIAPQRRLSVTSVQNGAAR
jgi:ABC-type protease/lipase transport system fused ATPase/permease subunit